MATSNRSSTASRSARKRSAGNAICISLDPSHVEVLERLAETIGSRSAAVRVLIDEHERSRKAREIEAAYGTYFADPGASARDRALTEEMLPVARWPEGPPAEEKRHVAGRKRTSR